MVRAIRGAIQVDANDRESILAGVTELVTAVMERNRLTTDDVISGHGVNVYIDPKAVMFLLGSIMDYETTKLRSGFVFQNPNEVSSCGCGESVMLKPAEMPA